MAMDSYSSALQSRRGKSIDGSLMGLAGPHAGETEHGGRGSTDAPPPSPLGEHTPPVHETHEVPPPASRLSPTHMDEHVAPVGEMGRGNPQPHAQSDGTGGGELHAQIGDHVMGNATKEEYELLSGSGMKPRSLGERAKMTALKAKFSGDEK